MVLLVVYICASHFYSIQNVRISIHGRECEGSAYTTYPCLQLPTYFFSSLALVILTRVSRLAVFAGNTLPCMVETLNCRWKFAIIYYCYDPIIMWWCVNYLLGVWNTSQLHSFWWTLWLVELWVALLVILLFGMYINHIRSVSGDRCIERFVNNYAWCL